MKAIMIMYDSLNREMLESYGCDWTKTPNFKRLAEKTVQFENSYVTSLPCMPARRELHTGRSNFLHRSWSPIEPFDDSMPEILKNNGIHSHLTTDHQHYWEDGGATYHTRYSSWEISRGQEGDPGKAHLGLDFDLETGFNANLSGNKMFDAMKKHDIMNRHFMDVEEKMPQAVTFKNGLEFIENNKEQDNWFLQIETFDPHEPFYTIDEYKELYPHEYDGKTADWPPYGPVQEDEKTVEHVKYEYAALLSMCDAYLGKVLDIMDENDMWKDTMLIVNTDHGYLLGEHGWWSKTVMPTYNEIAHTPLYIWDPRTGVKGESRQSLVQTIDLAPTLLDFFGQEIPKDMMGKSLRGVIENDTPVREYAVFGYHGGHINITDGKHLYMRAPVNMDNSPLYEYTLMPTHMRTMFKPHELQDITLREPFSFTKGCKVMKIDASKQMQMTNPCQYGNLLFDLEKDAKQLNNLDNTEVEAKMIKAIWDYMIENDSPEEQYERLGIPRKDGVISKEELLEQRRCLKEELAPVVLKEYEWEKSALLQVKALFNFIPPQMQDMAKQQFEGAISAMPNKNTVTSGDIMNFADMMMQQDPDKKEMVKYLLNLQGRTR